MYVNELYFLRRPDLAKLIRRLIRRRFPSYLGNQKSSFGGIPGFWIDQSGKAGLWTDREYSVPMLLIPYRDANGLIQACQIRFMSRAPRDTRYVWFSTPQKTEGISSGTPLHFASRKKGATGKPVLVTEGALKAQTAQVFKPEFTVIAAGGVSCSHDEIIAATRLCPMIIAFDSDYRHNRQVARHIVGLLEKRFADAKRYGYDVSTNLLVLSDKYKGIDDALLDKASFQLKNPSEWIESLDFPLVQEYKI